MNAPAVRIDRDGGIARIVFDRPERLNPLSLDFQTGLRDALAAVRDDRGVRAVVMTGAGRAFCVGADLSALGGGEEGGEAGTDGPVGPSLGERAAAQMTTLSNPLILALRALPVPVVAAVNGPCAGAGVGIALAADIVIAARSAYFYLPFMPRLGIVPDLGTTWFLERLLGRARATGLTLLGDRLPAARALDWGLVWDVVDDEALPGAALAAARRLAELPAHGVLETRRAFDAAQVNDLATQLDYEAGRQRELLDRPSFREGVAAFLGKREPRFEPR